MDDLENDESIPVFEGTTVGDLINLLCRQTSELHQMRWKSHSPSLMSSIREIVEYNQSKALSLADRCKFPRAVHIASVAQSHCPELIERMEDTPREGPPIGRRLVEELLSWAKPFDIRTLIRKGLRFHDGIDLLINRAAEDGSWNDLLLNNIATLEPLRAWDNTMSGRGVSLWLTDEIFKSSKSTKIVELLKVQVRYFPEEFRDVLGKTLATGDVKRYILFSLAGARLLRMPEVLSDADLKIFVEGTMTIEGWAELQAKFPRMEPLVEEITHELYNG